MTGRLGLLARLAASVALAGIAALVTDVAHADTPVTGWDAVRDPAAAARFATHLRVQEILASPHTGPREPLLVRARTLLLEAHAATSPDVRLRFDLGKIYEALDDNVHAKAVLAPAVEAAPDDPAVDEAVIALANAYAKLDESADERRVYERFLPRVTDDRSRSTAMLNLAEADMHLGDLESSIAGYRATKDLAGQLPNMVELTLHTGALAVWGLAVALDRSGDITAGAREASLAVSLDRDMGVIRLDPAVFFSPARERNWYVALGFTEYAKQAQDPRAAATWLHRAEECWSDYVKDASDRGATDRWVDIAKVRIERTRAQRLAVERRVKGRIVYPDSECVR